MSELRGRGAARAVADLAAGLVAASVEIAASPERVFRALASDAIVDWWGRPGVFETAEWSGDVRVGGRWRASGLARGKPWALEGEYLKVDAPRELVHTWGEPGSAETPSVVTYVLEEVSGGTRLTLRHVGLASRDSCMGAGMGWEACLHNLARDLGALNDEP